MADRYAKLACGNPYFLPIKIPYTDFIPKVKTYIKNLWKERFSLKHYRIRPIKLFTINPEIKPFYTNGLNRKDEVIIHRVRIGHTRFTHSYVMEGIPIDNVPLCPFCHDFGLSVKHLLIECDHFDHIRSRYYGGARDMGDLFERFSLRHILGFLRETHLYEQM